MSSKRAGCRLVSKANRNGQAAILKHLFCDCLMGCCGAHHKVFERPAVLAVARTACLHMEDIFLASREDVVAKCGT